MSENPQPTGPLPENPVEKKPVITGVKVDQYLSGIPLKGIESVQNALNLFSSGSIRGSRATEQNQLKAVSESQGSLAAGFYLIAAPHMQNNSSFVSEMMKEAKPAIQSRGGWSRSYDYDGVGSFFKTTVDINGVKDQKDSFVLQLNAAYVGNKVEEGLAESLNIERGLSWKNAEVEYEPEGDKFQIDFDEIAGRLKGVVDYLQEGKKVKPVTGADIVKQLTVVDKHGENEGPYVLGIKDGVEVTVGLGRVGRRFEWSNGQNSEDRWQVEGSTIKGPLDTDYSDETKFVPPTISITARPFSKERWNKLPAVDPKIKATMNNVISMTATAFEKK